MPYQVYGQRDPRWAAAELGSCAGITIGQSGCYLCALAMEATALGHGATPDVLNNLFARNGIYVNGCDLVDNALALLGQRVAGSTAWSFIGTMNGATAQSPQNWHSEPGQAAILGIHEVDHDHFLAIVSWNGSTLLVADPWFGDVVDFDARYQRSQIFKLARTAAPAIAPPAPPSPASPAEQFVARVKQALADLHL